jgi:Na+/melibiose symporter-like transporter
MRWNSFVFKFTVKIAVAICVLSLEASGGSSELHESILQNIENYARPWPYSLLVCTCFHGMEIYNENNIQTHPFLCVRGRASKYVRYGYKT